MSRFKTIEVSGEDSGHLRHICVHSPALNGRGDITVFVPPGDHKDLPVALLLHGVYGSHWGWALQGAAHITALELITTGNISPMILAMPSDGLWGGGSGYIAHDGKDFEAWIIDDVVEAVRECVPQAGARLFITGLSMGGYGALRLGAKHPARFKAISGHSSVTELEQLTGFTGEAIKASDEGTVLATMLRNKDKLPPLRFDCGLQDDLLKHNRELDRRLKEAGVSHEYQEFEGGHEWSYWREHLRDTLLFFNRHRVNS